MFTPLDYGQIAHHEIPGAALLGAMAKPQLPITTVVTPSAGEGEAVGSQVNCAS